MKTAANALHEAEFSTLLISHGGPTSALYHSLTGQPLATKCGFCALFCYTKSNEGSGVDWEAPIVANHDHLAEVPEGATDGPNDSAEQTSVPAS